MVSGSVLARVNFAESSRTVGWRTIALDTRSRAPGGRTYVASVPRSRWRIPVDRAGPDVCPQTERLRARRRCRRVRLRPDQRIPHVDLARVELPGRHRLQPFRHADAPERAVDHHTDAFDHERHVTCRDAYAEADDVRRGRGPRSELPVRRDNRRSAGSSLTPYTGPCSIQTNNVVIDRKTINCDLRILVAKRHDQELGHQRDDLQRPGLLQRVVHAHRQ